MKQRLRGKELRDAIAFIVSERLRFSQMSLAELREALKDSFLFELPAPDGHGSVLIGRAAGMRLQEIAKEALASSNLQDSVSCQTMLRIIKPEFVKRFLTEARPVDQKQADRFISWLGKEAERQCAPRTHLVPCHLMLEQEPEELRVGPVVFRPRRRFYRNYKSALVSYAPRGSTAYQRGLLRDALYYYRGFKWFAEVPVAPADPQTSQNIALEAARAALNGLHVVLGAQASNRMIVGGPRMTRDHRGHITIESDGQASVCLNMTGPGQVGFSKGWSLNFADSDMRYYLDKVGICLEVAVNPNLNRVLSRRVLDAIYWYGEAVRDSSDAARVVKYATALERMLMTSEHEDIARYVSERCAAFCWIGDTSRNFDEWKLQAKDLYNLRSRLVHGDMSPLSAEVGQGAQLGASLTRMAILSVLNHFEEQSGLAQEKVSNKRLAKWFNHHATLASKLAMAGLSPTAPLPQPPNRSGSALLSQVIRIKRRIIGALHKIFGTNAEK